MIRTHQVDATLHIALSGQLSLLALYELTDILMQVADSCEEYCLDMSEVITISDGALAALIMFIRHARRVGRHTRLTGCHWRFSRRLASIPALHELFEQAPHTGTMPQRGWMEHIDDVTGDTSDCHYSHLDSFSHDAGRETDKITWH